MGYTFKLTDGGRSTDKRRGGKIRMSRRNKITRDKNCYCYTCNQEFHYLGITNHRAGHMRRSEKCVIMFTNGNVRAYKPSPKTKRKK